MSGPQLTDLGPGAVSLTDPGGRPALPDRVAGLAADPGLAPEAGALRRHLGVGRGLGRAAREGRAGQVRAVPGAASGSVITSDQAHVTIWRSGYDADICCGRIRPLQTRETRGSQDCI